MNTLRFGAILAVLAATTFGCGGDDDAASQGAAGAAGAAANGEAGAAAEGGASAQAEPLELIGKYSDSFGSTQTITETNWNDSAIVGYDNAANVVYTQFPESDEFNPGKFAKTVYTDVKAGSFYFCMVEFSLDSLAAAKASKTTADDSDPDNSGCGGEFPWTKATAL